MKVISLLMKRIQEGYDKAIRQGGSVIIYM
jgi:hypothetical protein